MVVVPGPGGQGTSLWIAYYVSQRDFSIERYEVLGQGKFRPDPTTYRYLPAADLDPLLSDIAVGPKGDAVLVFQTGYSKPGPSNIYAITIRSDEPPGFLKDSDVVLVNTTQVGGFYPIAAQEKNKIDASVRLAWDQSKGPPRGNLYLIYTDQADS